MEESNLGGLTATRLTRDEDDLVLLHRAEDRVLELHRGKLGSTLLHLLVGRLAGLLLLSLLELLADGGVGGRSSS